MENSKRTRVVGSVGAREEGHKKLLRATNKKVIITGRSYKFVPKPLQYC
jgi:hypothetical protein